MVFTTILWFCFPAQPNGVRLSCAAEGYDSQLQFYYEGRRQLQPHVRQLRQSCYPRDPGATGEARA